MRLLLLIALCLSCLPAVHAIGDADEPKLTRWREFYPSKRTRRLYTTYEQGDEKVQHGYDVYFYDRDGSPKRAGFYFRDGQRHGAYKAWYPNQELKEEGQFEEGQREGTWTWYDAKGKKLQEISYRAGAKHGNFVRWDAMGTLEIERHYENDQRHGPERHYFSNGQLKTLFTWNRGNLEGKAATWFVNGQQRETLGFLDGERHGTYQEWFDNGQLKQVATYEKGQLNGPWERYDETGRQLEKGEYRLGEKWQGQFRELGDLPDHEWLNLYHEGRLLDGVLYAAGKPKNGSVQLWHTTGNVQRQYQYINGRLEGKEFWWHPDGQLHKEMTWVANKLQGAYSEWYPNGTPRWLVTMREGERHGVETRWSPRGEVIARGEYRQGEPWDGLFFVEREGGGGDILKYEGGVQVELTPEDLRPRAPATPPAASDRPASPPATGAAPE